DDWCEEHGVPESICVECNKDLLPKEQEYGWCKVHGVAECPIDHPEVATPCTLRSEEHTSELQSRFDLVCRLLLEKKNFNKRRTDLYSDAHGCILLYSCDRNVSGEIHPFAHGRQC